MPKLNAIVIILAVFTYTSVFAYNEDQLIDAMTKNNFSASLISTTIDIARDLNDKTGCFQTSKTRPSKDRILACEYKLAKREQSMCHLVDLKTHKIESGYVAFGEKGMSNGPRPGALKTPLGVFTLDNKINSVANKKQSLGSSFASSFVRHDGRVSKNQLGMVYYPDTQKTFKKSNGTPALFGDFAKTVLKNAKSTVLINHSLDVPYDNACGKLQARRNYKSDQGIAKVLHRSYKPGKPQDPMRKQESQRLPASFSKPVFDK